MSKAVSATLFATTVVRVRAFISPLIMAGL
jgi:hypothetical protein